MPADDPHLKARLAVRPVSVEEAAALFDAGHPYKSHKRIDCAHGVFWDGKLSGALGWGRLLNDAPARHLNGTRATVPELLRMWLADALPRNSESRALAESVRLLRAARPEVVGVVTYCMASDPAYGYRAAGWQKGPTHSDGGGSYTRYSLGFAPPKKRSGKVSAAESELRALRAQQAPPDVRVRSFAHTDAALWPLVGPFAADKGVAKELGGGAFGDAGTVWLVADVAGAVAGFCTIRPERARYWFENAYVLPDYRGRGVFAALAAAREAELLKLPPLPVRTRVRLPRWEHYENRGFARVGVGNTNWVVGERPARTEG